MTYLTIAVLIIIATILVALARAGEIMEQERQAEMARIQKRHMMLMDRLRDALARAGQISVQETEIP